MSTFSRLPGSRADSSISMKRARSPVSRHSVKTSSNWSTTTQLSGSSSAGARRRPYASAGRAPGVKTRSTAGCPCSAIASRSRGISPARSSEDLPLPDGPNSTASRWSHTSRFRSSLIRSRPKKRCRSSGSKRARPRYGGAASGSSSRTAPVVAASASFQRGSHSAGSPSQARTYPSTTAQDGSRSPAAAWDNVVGAKPAFLPMARYEGPPAACRSSRSSCASRCTGPASGSTGLSGRPMGSHLLGSVTGANGISGPCRRGRCSLPLVGFRCFDDFDATFRQTPDGPRSWRTRPQVDFRDRTGVLINSVPGRVGLASPGLRRRPRRWPGERAP